MEHAVFADLLTISFSDVTHKKNRFPIQLSKFQQNCEFKFKNPQNDGKIINKYPRKSKCKCSFGHDLMTINFRKFFTDCFDVTPMTGKRLRHNNRRPEFDSRPMDFIF